MALLQNSKSHCCPNGTVAQKSLLPKRHLVCKVRYTSRRGMAIAERQQCDFSALLQKGDGVTFPHRDGKDTVLPFCTVTEKTRCDFSAPVAGKSQCDFSAPGWPSMKFWPCRLRSLWPCQWYGRGVWPSTKFSGWLPTGFPASGMAAYGVLGVAPPVSMAAYGVSGHTVNGGTDLGHGHTGFRWLGHAPLKDGHARFRRLGHTVKSRPTGGAWPHHPPPSAQFQVAWPYHPPSAAVCAVLAVPRIRLKKSPSTRGALFSVGLKR